MRSFIKSLFFSTLFLLLFQGSAYANISPLKILEDGVEPVESPDVKIESADITVTPSGSNFLFNCKYALVSDSDMAELTLGIPGDLGYTLEAGYIENMNIQVDGKLVKYKIYNTTGQPAAPVQDSKTSMHFKWHVFSMPVKRGVTATITATYNISWRISEQNKSSKYYIIPFIMSTDSLLGGVAGKYRITYINDDNISPPDVKVMINSMLEPDIVSPAVLTPQYEGNSITWEFKNAGDFQDFRLIVLSFHKISSEFYTGTSLDNSIKWATLNSNYSRMASLFEQVAKDEDEEALTSEERGIAAYLASEYYFRIEDYDKSLEMLRLPNKTTLWPSTIKYEYINSIKLMKKREYEPLLDTLTKLSGYKDYVLVSQYAESQIKPVEELLNAATSEHNIPGDAPAPEEEIRSFEISYIWIIAGAAVLSVAIIIVYRIVSSKKKKTFW